MKKLLKILVPFVLVPVSLNTLNAKVTSGESTYVLQTTNREEIQGDELDSECSRANPLIVVSGTKADLYSIQTESAHGRIVNDSVKRVGKLIVCVVAPTYTSNDSPFYEGLGENLYNSPPSQNINIAFSIFLNGQQYYATGSGRFRTNPVWGLPYPGFYLLGATATVFKLVDGARIDVGSYTANAAFPFPGTTDNLDKQGGIIVLRISEPGYTQPN
jgi:hypothetical protein